ncbi:hypothetical protein BZG36_01727 [Bifiguratus adelaidae]|uniref:Uncharacterized protein n=1 Tax=Bifiguratus adelaidae TaxID=1938954 RepID=A0A261Y4Q3_9FUNG|nr:hypothetical protein BZG36_01727 [Bifiguratus adelaidae]
MLLTEHLPTKSSRLSAFTHLFKWDGPVSTFEQDPFRNTNAPQYAGGFIDPLNPNNKRSAHEVDPLGGPDTIRSIAIHYNARPVDRSSAPHTHNGLWCRDPMCTGSLQTRDPLDPMSSFEGKQIVGWVDPMNPNRPYRFTTEYPTFSTTKSAKRTIAKGRNRSYKSFWKRNNGVHTA